MAEDRQRLMKSALLILELGCQYKLISPQKNYSIHHTSLVLRMLLNTLDAMTMVLV